MSTPLRLAPGTRAFLEHVVRLVVTNPFGAEREAVERELDPGSGQGSLARIAARLTAELQTLGRSGPALVRRAAADERDTVAYASLFEVYLARTDDLDAHIVRQAEAPEETCAVPFADELLGALERRGFTRAEALKSLGLFFQLRRAYFFIDRALVGSSPCMQALREALWNDVFTRDIRGYERWLWGRMEDFSTLLLGETGTGKGSAAAAIGRSGFIPFDPRHGRFAESFAGAFVSVNLSEFPESLIESELFGHEKGAFTGALAQRDGVLARCSPHGAILLDEIGELAAPVQIKLLRVLQERVFVPVGGRRARRFSGRVIAATNRDLGELRAGSLRDDFYYRLCSDVIHVPTLRQRLEEAPGELELLVERLLVRLVGGEARALVAPVREALERGPGPHYAWPGNVRELEQCVRRILLKGSYEAGPEPPARPEADPFLARVGRGELDADELLGAYCARLLERFGSYDEVARRTRLDRRTVKRYVGLGTRLAP